MLVDNAAMQLVARPSDFDVVLTENMFGDILSDEAAMIAGSIGLLAVGQPRQRRAGSVRARARLGARHRRQGVANPLAMFGSVALMLRHSLGMEDAAAAVESAIDRVLERGLRTPDLASGPRRRDAWTEDWPEGGASTRSRFGTAEMTTGGPRQR